MGDLVYSFLLTKPMIVLYVDIYVNGTKFNYEVNKHYLIAGCDMTTSTFVEPTINHNSTVFALTLM